MFSSIIAELNIVKEKELKKLLNYKRVDLEFSSHQRYWESFEQENNSVAINGLFLSHNSEEIKLAYKSSYNKRKNQVILLMINDEQKFEKNSDTIALNILYVKHNTKN